MSNVFLSSGQYACIERILLDGCGRYGATAVERLRYAFAIAAGLAPAVSPKCSDQRPQFVVPGLTARRFHEASDYGFSRYVEASAAVIRSDLENVLRNSSGFQPYRQDCFVPSGRWDAFYIRVGNIWLDENRELCPRTFRILESVPRLAEVAMFSALSAGGHIAPHCGDWNCRITFHLGLNIPQDCALRVGNEARAWESDKLTVFDDTFEHEAWNRSDETRYVLLFDVWHPDLSDIEVDLLEQLRVQAGIHDGKATVEQIRADRIKHLEGGCRPIASKPASREREQGIDDVKPISIRRSAMSDAAFSNSIDWSRLAEPQADQYDSDVILHLASSTTSIDRPQPYRRTPVGESPAVFDGQVAVRHVYRTLPEFEMLSASYLDGPADHPNIPAAAEHIRNWPIAFAQCQRLLEAIHPALDPQIPLESDEIYRGSSCHSYERLFGTMWATIFCPLGLAEAIVHEMAHQKLRMLGVAFESAASVVGNDPARLYDSPIIKDRLRPMTAVLHAEYSYVHVTALDIHMLQAERDPARRAVLGSVLETNLSRIEEGYDTLLTHFEPGEHGREFLDGFSGWTERTIASARDLLGRGPRQGETASSRPAPVRFERHPVPRMPADLRAAQAPVVFAYNGGVGDRLCNLPALRALASLFPGRLALVCGKGDRQLYYSDLNLHAVHEIELARTDIGWTFDAEDLARRIAGCDLLLCINPWHTSSVSELLARFPDVESIGFFPDFRRHLTCDYEGHAIDMAFAVPAFLSGALNLADVSQPPAISGMASAMAQVFKQRYAGSQPTLFVHTDTGPEKSWPRERFERVLDGFLSEFPEFKAVIVDLRGEGIGRVRFPDRVLPVNLPLDACFALLRDSDVFLGIDSCHLHAADLFRVPGVGLFGPTTCRRWGFRFSKHRHIEGRGSMDTINADEVCEALCSLARAVVPASSLPAS